MADIADQGGFNLGLANIASANYGPTAVANQGTMNAQASLTGQQAQTATMNNQIQRATMPMIMQALNEAQADQSGTNAGNPNAGTGTPNAANANANQSGGALYDTGSGGLEEAVRQQNFVQPWTQSELAQLKYGNALSMSPNNAQAGAAIVARVETMRQARIANQTAANQRNMNNVYDTSTAVADPTNPTPFKSLLAADPKDAAAINPAAARGDVEPTPDDDAKAQKYATHLAFVAHQHTGAPTKQENGVLIDENRGEPVTGQSQYFTGLTGEQRANFRNFALEKVDVPHVGGATTQEPRWSAPKPYGLGGETPDQYVAKQELLARHLPDPTQAQPPRASSTPPSTNAPQAQNAPGNSPSAGAPTNAARTGPRPGPVAQPGTAAAAPGAQKPPSAQEAANSPAAGTPGYNQYMSRALNDTSYRSPYAPGSSALTKVGTPDPQVQKLADQYNAQRGEAQQEFSEHSAAASQSLLNFRAAQQILSSPDVSRFTAGPIGALLQRISVATGMPISSAQVRMEAAKYLVNGSVGSVRQMYGAKPAQYDVKLNVEKAFPSLDTMDVPTAQKLISSQITQAQYMLDSSKRGQAYIARGNSPLAFNDFNQQYFPRENILVPGASAKPATGAVTGGNAPVSVANRAEAMKLAPGTHFTTPDGRTLVR